MFHPSSTCLPSLSPKPEVVCVIWGVCSFWCAHSHQSAIQHACPGHREGPKYNLRGGSHMECEFLNHLPFLWLAPHPKHTHINTATYLHCVTTVLQLQPLKKMTLSNQDTDRSQTLWDTFTTLWPFTVDWNTRRFQLCGNSNGNHWLRHC